MSFLQRRFDCVVVVGVVKRRPNHAKAAMFRSFVDFFYKKSIFYVFER